MTRMQATLKIFVRFLKNFKADTHRYEDNVAIFFTKTQVQKSYPVTRSNRQDQSVLQKVLCRL